MCWTARCGIPGDRLELLFCRRSAACAAAWRGAAPGPFGAVRRLDRATSVSCSNVMPGPVTTGLMSVTSSAPVQVDGVEDAEALLVLSGPYSPRIIASRDPSSARRGCGCARDAGTRGWHDRRDVDARGEQVHGDGDVGHSLVLEAADQLQRLVAVPVIFITARPRPAPYVLRSASLSSRTTMSACGR